MVASKFPDTSDVLSPPDVICLMGPTATGKTALALALADRLPVEIVSVDASQVYRGLDIGTAKPTADEQARHPHRLIDIRDPADAYSAADFCLDARREIEEIVRAGRVPLLVGGTMFYFRSLMFGLSELPSADSAVRARLADEASRVGWQAMHARLATRDPLSAARIHPNDPQRIQRALEVMELTGRTLSDRQQASSLMSPPYRFTAMGLVPDSRDALHRRIAVRFHDMLRAGLINEVEGLRKRPDMHSGLPSMRTVGYRQIWEYLIGLVNYNEMVERVLAGTRQLARRQMTWLRSYPDVEIITLHETPPVDVCLTTLQKVETLREKLGL